MILNVSFLEMEGRTTEDTMADILRMSVASTFLKITKIKPHFLVVANPNVYFLL